MTTLWRVCLDSGKPEVEEMNFQGHETSESAKAEAEIVAGIFGAEVSVRSEILVCEEDEDYSLRSSSEGGLYVSLFEGDHPEYGDRDTGFPVDRLGNEADQFWSSSKELAELVREISRVAFDFGQKAAKEEVKQKLGL